MKSPITLDQSKRLIEIEKEIGDAKEQCERNFVLIGLRLAEVRDKSLYQADYNTFEEYIRERWGYKRSYAYQLIDSAWTVKSLPPEMSAIADKMNEAQARELGKVPQEHRAEVLEKIVDSGQPVTATAIRAEASPAPAKPTRQEPAAPPKPEPVLDTLGFEVTKEALPNWNRRDEVQQVLTALSKIRTLFKNLQEKGDTLWARSNANFCYSHLDKVYADVKASLPYAVCANCNGVNIHQCEVCRKSGVVSEWTYNTVPIEKRDFRLKVLKSSKK